MTFMTHINDYIAGGQGADRIVPPTGFTAWLTVFTAAAMAFLAVFALALSLSAGRLADRWEGALARTATVRISAPTDQIELQTTTALRILGETPGVVAANRLGGDEKRALLAPWFGPDLPLEALPVPEMIEISETGDGFDGEGLRLRLAAEVPGAVLDDHTRWRRPLVTAANRLRALGLLSILLITAATASMIALAARASLSANRNVIEVLRLIGAEDVYIARAFVRRFTIRALVGALAGVVLGVVAIAFLPDMDEAGSFLTELGYQGASWILPLLIPVLAAIVAFAATRFSALRMLKEIT